MAVRQSAVRDVPSSQIVIDIAVEAEASLLDKAWRGEGDHQL